MTDLLEIIDAENAALLARLEAEQRSGVPEFQVESSGAQLIEFVLRQRGKGKP